MAAARVPPQRCIVLQRPAVCPCAYTRTHRLVFIGRSARIHKETGSGRDSERGFITEKPVSYANIGSRTVHYCWWAINTPAYLLPGSANALWMSLNYTATRPWPGSAGHPRRRCSFPTCSRLMRTYVRPRWNFLWWLSIAGRQGLSGFNSWAFRVRLVDCIAGWRCGWNERWIDIVFLRQLVQSMSTEWR